MFMRLLEEFMRLLITIVLTLLEGFRLLLTGFLLLFVTLLEELMPFVLWLLNFYLLLICLRLVIVWLPGIRWYSYPFNILFIVTNPYLRLFETTIPKVFGIDFSSLLSVLFLQLCIDHVATSMIVDITF